MTSIGILAYGSLISDPGSEIAPLIVRRTPVKTPFPVEYARISRTRGGSPTVVPYRSGVTVNAEVLVLSDSVDLGEAKNLLWRRETRNEGSGKAYPDGNSPNAVLVKDEAGFYGMDHVLYTDFNPGGKVENPDARSLADSAIRSVLLAPQGMDGISYLISLLKVGVETALTSAYINEILVQTGAGSLEDALNRLSMSK